MTFSIVAGHFELVVNPSQRTGVIGHFLTPVQCSSDLLPDYCYICTLCSLMYCYSCTCIFLVLLPFFCGLLQIFKTSIQSEKSRFRQHSCIIIKYLLCETQVLGHDTVCMGMTFTTTVSVCLCLSLS